MQFHPPVNHNWYKPIHGHILKSLIVAQHRVLEHIILVTRVLIIKTDKIILKLNSLFILVNNSRNYTTWSLGLNL